jgi:hypothetical protein
VLSRSPALTKLSSIAGAQQRLDVTACHRGSDGPSLAMPATLFVLAHAYHSMIEPRSIACPCSVDLHDRTRSLHDLGI